MQKPATSSVKPLSSKGVPAKDVSFKDGVCHLPELVLSLTPVQEGFTSMVLGSTKAVPSSFVRQRVETQSMVALWELISQTVGQFVSD